MTDYPSPFLPRTKIQYAWDATSIGTFKTCPRLYYYQIICGWSTHAENIHLRWGIEYHHALESYDRYRAANATHEDAVYLVIRELLERIHGWNPNPRDGKRSEELKTKDALVRSVIWYLDQYPAETDPAKTLILENGKPAVEVNFKFELDWGPGRRETDEGFIVYDHTKPKSRVEITPEMKAVGYSQGYPEPQPYLLCGYLDRVVTYQSELFIMDRKTTTSTPGSFFFETFDPDNQMTTYTIAGQIVLNAPIRGVIIDAAALLTNSTNFARGMTYRSKDQITEWLHDLKFWLASAEQCATEEYWPMNDSSCGKYGGCRFREICATKSPKVREKFLKSNFLQLEEKDRWNPLRPRG